jgi:iron complex outermembrane recepter protein
MKAFLYWIMYMIISCGTILAQPEKPVIEGKVTDENNLPVEYTTVALYSLPDSTLLKGVIADDKGYFRIEDVKYGVYFLVSSNLGYKKIVSSAFTISKEQPKNYQEIKMNTDVTESQTVIIEALKTAIRQEAGSTVVSVENSPLNAGLSLVEVMKRVPGVTVDKDGQIKLKGKDGVMIMIDDKPLYMDAAQVATLLKSIPADQVKEIEVLTSPSAKYDAAGNAGIINIRLKKGAYEGLNGSANISAGHGIYPKAAAGINLSYKKNKFSVSGGYQYNYKKNFQKFFVDRHYSDYGDSSYNTSSTYSAHENAHNVLLNGSYEVGKKGSLSWSGNFMQEQSKWKGESGSYLYSQDGLVSASFLTEDSSIIKVYNINSAVGYKHTFDTTGTNLFIGTEYKTMTSHTDQIFSTYFYDAGGSQTGSPFEYKSKIPVTLDQWSVKADFTKMILKKWKLETGIKYNWIETRSNMSNSFVPSNNFTYTEHIPASYLLLQRKTKKWNLIGGVRMEYTSSKGIQKSIDSTVIRTYTNFFPNATVSYHSSEKTIYSILYSRRIQRPEYSDLNPFSYYNDPYNIYSGNPYLLPQYTHHTEFSVSNWSGVLLTTVNYSYTSQPHAQVWILDNTNLTTTFTSRNLISQENMGISIAVNTPATKWWTMSNYLYVYNNRLKGDVGFGEKGYSRNAWMFTATHNFKIPFGMAAELSGNYESPNYWGTVLYREVWQISAGIQKKLWKEKISLKLSVTDIFWKYVYLGTGNFGNIETKDGFKWDNRVVMISLNYRFGRKFIQNEASEKDQMESGGGRKR